MPQSRAKIPTALREAVLKSYNHRCAICGSDHPQIHHIDENPGNNDELNLLPLCPNCHLTDQHNPTEDSSSDTSTLSDP
jgi:5-methylcytosine-specific restriction endonuclease McrA